MASQLVRLKLKRLLSADTDGQEFDKSVEWLNDMKKWISDKFPGLQTTIVKGKSIAWLVISLSTSDSLYVLSLSLLTYLEAILSI